MNSRQLTNYIKGFAIVTVLVDHFSGQFLSNYYGWIGDYANGFIAVFFLFSGYGLFYSLQKRFAGGIRMRPLGRYFIDRAVRIIPFYWLSLFIAPWVFPGNFEILHRPGGWMIYLGLPFLGAPWLYWFLTALFQCYLVAPLVFLFVRKAPLWLSLTAAAAATAAALPLSMILPFTRLDDPLEYRYFLGAHLILFLLGMTAPAIVSKITGRVNVKMLLTALAGLLLSVYLTRTGDDFFTKSHIAFIPLMILSTFAAGVIWLSLRPQMPLSRVLGPLGQHSYPIYLFHIPFFGLLLKFDLLKNNDLMSIISILALIPVFFYVCVKTERGLGKATSLLANLGITRALKSATQTLLS